MQKQKKMKIFHSLKGNQEISLKRKELKIMSKKLIMNRCWQCNSLLTKTGECTNIGCMPIHNWKYEIDYYKVPSNLERQLLEKKYSPAYAVEARRELDFQIRTCKNQSHMRKMIYGACKKYEISLREISS